jgi:hypothetical protein
MAENDLAAAQLLVSDLKSQGFRLQEDGDNLKVCPAKKLTEADRLALRRLKTEILETLRKSATSARSATSATEPGAFPVPGLPAPPGARLFFADEACRPCQPAEAYIWTYEGAPQWYYAKRQPPPAKGRGKKDGPGLFDG